MAMRAPFHPKPSRTYDVLIAAISQRRVTVQASGPKDAARKGKAEWRRTIGAPVVAAVEEILGNV